MSSLSTESSDVSLTLMKVRLGNCPETLGTVPHDDGITFCPPEFSEGYNGVHYEKKKSCKIESY